MKYAVDKIEDNIATCENIETKEKIEINVNDLPRNIKDGSIIIFENNQYKVDESEEKLRRLSILEKFNKLKKK